jgi:mRNA interferase HigB
MRVITKQRINEFSEKYPNSFNSLISWFRIVSRSNFNSFADLRQTFPSANIVGKLTVFNIGGNKFRLIAAIHYNTQILYIRHILTHVEYNKNKWKNE